MLADLGRIVAACFIEDEELIKNSGLDLQAFFQLIIDFCQAKSPWIGFNLVNQRSKNSASRSKSSKYGKIIDAALFLPKMSCGTHVSNNYLLTGCRNRVFCATL